MAAGSTATAAFQQAFGDGATAELEKERLALVEKVAGGHIHLLYQDLGESAPAHVEERALRPAEVNLLWARLQIGNGKPGEAGARHFVQEALKAEPGLTAARLLDASLFDRERRFAEAEREITEAASAAPDDEHAARALFVVRSMPWKYGGDTALGFAKADEILAAWLPRAREALTLNMFAHYLATRGRSDEAVSTARRAATLDPTCARCFATLAAALFRSGQFTAAFDVQERGVAMLGEHSGWREMIDRLDLYRKATSAITAWKARPAPDPDAGVLPMDVATAVKQAQTFHLRECYDHGLSRSPKLTGSVVLGVTVSPEGKVTKVDRMRAENLDPKRAPLAPPLADEGVIACLTEQTRLFRFPESARGVRYIAPMNFVQGK
jgi:tetratricopeptide (TPR) repeat protein